MSKFLSKFEELSDSEQDQWLETNINGMLDRALRSKLEHQLAEDYQITKVAPRKRRWITLVSSAAGVLLLLAAGWYLFSPNLERQTDHWIQETFNHPGLTKGESESSEAFRISAIEAYGKKDYASAFQAFAEIQDPAPLDLLFGGISALRIGNFEEALSILDRAEISPNSNWYQEYRWYRALILIKLGRLEQASEVLRMIGENEWKYEESKKLLRRLN